MISECIWSRKPTLSIAPAAAVHTPDEATYRQWLAGEGWCAELTLDDISAAGIETAIAALAPITENPLDSLAHLLSEHLGAAIDRMPNHK